MNNQFVTIYVVRHGECVENVLQDTNSKDITKSFGEHGSPLTEKGRTQATKAAEILKNVPFDAIFSSDLVRAKETAEIIAANHKVPVVTISTIRERDFGIKMTKAQRAEIDKSVKALNDEEKFAFKYSPEGESSKDALERFLTFLEEIVPVYFGKTVLVVNHGNIMRSFLIRNGFARADELASGTIDNTGYYVIKTDGKNVEIGKTHGVHKKGKGKAEA